MYHLGKWEKPTHMMIKTTINHLAHTHCKLFAYSVLIKNAYFEKAIEIGVARMQHIVRSSARQR